MNCYFCLLETGCASRSAFAICQRCGAGMCDLHLVLIRSAAGMAGERSQSFICSQCSRPATLQIHPSRPAKESVRQNRKPRPSWWRWLYQNHIDPLPEPEQAVAAVERFLKRQRP